MAREKIVLMLEGPGKNNGHLELSVFVEKIRHFLDLLNRSVKESSKERVVFRVIHLSHSSPVTIECEPVVRDTEAVRAKDVESARVRGGEIATAGDLEAAHGAINVIGKNMMCVEEKKTYTLSHPVLSAMERLAKFRPTKIARAEVRIIGGEDEREHIYKLDDRFKEQLSNARRMEERVVSTIDGRLERINIHNNANTFGIYPTLPMVSPVRCTFPQELLEQVLGALGSFVSVSGECLYRPEAPFPYRMDVHDMTVLPLPESLPTLSDLYGIAPDATGSKSSEQFVRELRDAIAGMRMINEGGCNLLGLIGFNQLDSRRRKRGQVNGKPEVDGLAITACDIQ